MDSNSKPRVLFTYVEAGMGHIIPMTGISQAFTRKYGDKCEIINSYVFKESKNSAVNAMAKEFSGAVKSLNKNYILNRLEAFSYRLGNKLTHFGIDLHFKKGIEQYTKELIELAPDLVVGSYYMPTHIASKAVRKKRLDTLTATYSPDCYIYPAWERRCDLFMVNNDMAYGMTQKGGFDVEKVKKIPFIYRENITGLDVTKEQACDQVGLDKTKFRILYTSGAYGIGTTRKSRKLIKLILKSGLNAELIIICGKNPNAEKYLNGIKEKFNGSVSLKIVSYTDKMEYFMRGADVIIGKSGTNTVMESLYIGTPIIINESVNRLEEITAKWAVKCKYATVANTPKKVMREINKIVEDGRSLDVLADGCHNYEKNSTGAEQAADLLFELLKTRFPNL